MEENRIDQNTKRLTIIQFFVSVKSMPIDIIIEFMLYINKFESFVEDLLGHFVTSGENLVRKSIYDEVYRKSLLCLSCEKRNGNKMQKQIQ